MTEGFVDSYPFNLPNQFIDSTNLVTRLFYYLLNEVNPLKMFGYGQKRCLDRFKLNVGTPRTVEVINFAQCYQNKGMCGDYAQNPGDPNRDEL